MKKSLLTKLLVLFSLIGILPLTVAAIYSYHKSRAALLSNAHHDMATDAKDIASNINRLFLKARSDLLLLTANPAFKRYFLEPEQRSFWLKELQKAFLYLSSIFPDSFDEGCFILASGREVCRVVYDRLAAFAELSMDESRNAFFAPTLLIPEGEVYQGVPYISTDTNRWVLPNAMPVALPDGRKVAVAHMELRVAYLKNIIREVLSEGIEDGFIVDNGGRIIAATGFDIKDKEPFPKAGDRENSLSYSKVIERMKRREMGFEKIVYESERYLIAFHPVPFSRYNENRWTVGVMIPEDKVYETITPTRYIVMVLFGSGIVAVTAVFFGTGIVMPIRKITAISAELAKGDLKKRVDIKRVDEIGHLAEAFNEMASSLDRDRYKLMKELEVSNTLLKILGFFISLPRMQDILPRIVDGIRNLIPCDTCSIMLLDENREFLTIRASHGLDEKYAKKAMQKVGDGIAGWVFLHNKPLLLKGPVQEGRFKNYLEHEKDIGASICIPVETKDGIIGVVSITTKGGREYGEDDMRRLTLIVKNLAIAIENARLFEEVKKTNFEVIIALAQALEARDVYTRGHGERMIRLALSVAERLGLSEERKELLKYAAILHDIGKIGVPDNILNKPGRLTDEEYELLKQHSIKGAEIVGQVNALAPIASIVLHHQERWDGRGYPDGLKGEKIPVEARIVSVLDAYDAMTSDRPYRKALTIDAAIEELRRYSGTQFDPQVVDAFLAELRKDLKNRL